MGRLALQASVAAATKAKSVGARVALVTIVPDSAIGKLADVIVVVPAPSPKAKAAAKPAVQSAQPMGALFEQTMALLFDAVIVELMRRTGQDSAAMFARHANLE